MENVKENELVIPKSEEEKEVEFITLQQLYFEETQGALQYEQCNFLLVNNLYDGAQNI